MSSNSEDYNRLLEELSVPPDDMEWKNVNDKPYAYDNSLNDFLNSKEIQEMLYAEFDFAFIPIVPQDVEMKVAEEKVGDTDDWRDTWEKKGDEMLNTQGVLPALTYYDNLLKTIAQNKSQERESSDEIAEAISNKIASVYGRAYWKDGFGSLQLQEGQLFPKYPSRAFLSYLDFTIPMNACVTRPIKRGELILVEAPYYSVVRVKPKGEKKESFEGQMLQLLADQIGLDDYKVAHIDQVLFNEGGKEALASRYGRVKVSTRRTDVHGLSVAEKVYAMGIWPTLGLIGNRCNDANASWCVMGDTLIIRALHKLDNGAPIKLAHVSTLQLYADRFEKLIQFGLPRCVCTLCEQEVKELLNPRYGFKYYIKLDENLKKFKIAKRLPTANQTMVWGKMMEICILLYMSRKHLQYLRLLIPCLKTVVKFIESESKDMKLGLDFLTLGYCLAIHHSEFIQEALFFSKMGLRVCYEWDWARNTRRIVKFNERTKWIQRIGYSLELQGGILNMEAENDFINSFPPAMDPPSG